MSDPLDRRDELERALELAAAEARAYLEGLAGDPVQPPGSAELLGEPVGELPAPRRGRASPRSPSWHGSAGRPAPAPAGRASSTSSSAARRPPLSPPTGSRPRSTRTPPPGWPRRFGTRLEQVAIDWLRQLFRLPEEFGGVLVTGGTMANFTCLAAAREWCAERGGFSAARTGSPGAPQIPVLTSGYVHASAMKSLALLGHRPGNVAQADPGRARAARPGRRWPTGWRASTARPRS